MEPTSAPAGWHPDPTGRFEFRYFNGQRWTSDVSVHGQRFLDQVGPAAYQPGWGPAAPTPRGPSRGFSLASFWVALASFLLGWVPFVFAIAAAGALTALVFGIVGLGRVRRNEGAGRGYAVTGIVLAVAAIGMSVLGFFFTREVMRELDAFFDAGPHSVQIDSCVLTDGLVRLDGSITNEDDVTHSYTIDVAYRSDGDELDRDQATVNAVSPGETAEFHTTAFLEAPSVECTIEGVNGPSPFAVDP